jgi:U3 small nucleolar RNA-associated protein 18
MARKKQKLAQAVERPPPAEPRPLGFVAEDVADKDDEERRLESILFGIPFEPAPGKHARASDIDGDETLWPASDIVGKETENLMDKDVSTGELIFTLPGC